MKISKDTKDSLNGGYVTTRDFEILTEDVRVMAESVKLLVDELRDSFKTFVGALSGKVPMGYMPLESHRLIVKWLLIGNALTLAVAVGVVKYLPQLLDIL